MVFHATGDAHFAADDAKNGERKWQFFTQTSVVAVPISYDIDGEQYVAVASGWGGSFVPGFGGVFPTGSENNAGRTLVFRLGANGTLPELENKPELELTIPAMLDVPETTIVKSLQLYANNCVTCHGDQAFSSGLVANLRYTAITANNDAFKASALEGGLAKQRVPNFGKALSEEEVEVIRAHIIAEANSPRDREFCETIDSK